MTTKNPTQRFPDFDSDDWRKLVAGCDNTSDDRVVHFTEYLKEKALENFTTYKSNFPEFDAKLDGLCSGEVTVISGKTGEGKTTFAESWIHGLMQKSGIRSCVFSYEVLPQMLLSKYKENPELPIYLPMSLMAMNLEWLYGRIIEARNKYGCKVFLLDHLHFLVDMATKQNMSLNIGAFMRRLKQEIAIGLDVAVILIAHQRSSENGESASLESIRDSSFIAQEADNVIVVWREPDPKENELLDIKLKDPAYYARLERRMPAFRDLSNEFSFCLEKVQIAKARRSGTFRWGKLFQKAGHFFEEV